MLRITAKIASWFLHPLLIPAIAIFVIFNSGTYISYIAFSAQKVIYGLVVITTLFLPLTIIPFLLNLNVIKSIQMRFHKERVVPLLITALNHLLCFYLLSNLPFPVPKFVRGFILACCIVIFLSALISLTWKISIYMTGIGALLGMMIALSLSYNADLFNYIITIAVFAGMLGSARLILKTHTQPQVYAGVGLGSICLFVPLYFLI